MATLTEHLQLNKPDVTDNISPQPFNENFDTLDNEIHALKTDYVVAQGEQGLWTYRRWASGIAECWIEAYKRNTIEFKSGWGQLNTAKIDSPGDYPFTFKTAPIVIPTWSSMTFFSSPIWAEPNGTVTTCPSFRSIDCNSGTQKNIVLGVYVKGTWK